MIITQHLKERHFNTKRYNGIQIYNDVVIMPLWNLSGQYIGYQQYRPGAGKERMNDPREGRYYTSLHGDKNEKPLAVWGLESLDYHPSCLVVVEGVFDACRLHNLGVPCVAALSSNTKHLRNWLFSLGRKIYKVEDTERSHLGPYTNLTLPQGRKDLGECTDEEIMEVLGNVQEVQSPCKT